MAVVYQDSDSGNNTMRDFLTRREECLENATRPSSVHTAARGLQWRGLFTVYIQTRLGAQNGALSYLEMFISDSQFHMLH